jgi:hypothetical protein
MSGRCKALQTGQSTAAGSRRQLYSGGGHRWAWRWVAVDGMDGVGFQEPEECCRALSHCCKLTGQVCETNGCGAERRGSTDEVTQKQDT